MEQKQLIERFLEWFIWGCLVAIFFSVLYVDGRLFFPFITSKTAVFLIATELMFVAFLFLCWLDKKYRLHINSVVVLAGVYLIILTVASLLGNDFYRSFWSNNERSDGILLLIHLFLFVLVLTSRFRSLKEWLLVFDIFLAASLCVSLVALDQYFGGNHFLASSNGTRLASTIGNAGYVGGYMVFGVFLSLFMFFKRNNNWFKIYYAFIFLLELFIAIQTQTRGAYLALAMGLGVSFAYFTLFYYNDKRLKILFVLVLISSVIGISSLFIFKDSDFVKDNSILNRISSISFTEATANNRLITWKIGWQGLKEKPLLGYGQENFYQVFDKYYTTKNTEQWFDRCHNMICDRAITGGILGLLGYLALLLLPFWGIWRYYRKEYIGKMETNENFSRRYFTPIIFSILILAYIIQNMFIFEALVTYVPLMMVLSFVGLYGKKFDFSFLDNQSFKKAASVLALVVLPFSINNFVIIPIGANTDFIKALSRNDLSLESRILSFEEIIARETLGNQEYRKQYAMVFDQYIYEFMNNPQIRTEENAKLLSDFADKIEFQLQEQIKENPHSVINYLTLMRFYNTAYIFNVERLNKSLLAFQKAIELSPNRPPLYYEVASTYYYLGNYYLTNKQSDLAAQNYRESLDYFYRGASLNQNKLDFFDQLVGFMNSIASTPNNKEIAKAWLSGKIGDNDLDSIVEDLFKNLDSADSIDDELVMRKNQLRSILNWLILVDPENKDLQDKIKLLK